MIDTNSFQTIQNKKYKNNYLINEQGKIVDTVNKSYLVANSRHQYTLKIVDGGTERRTIKSIYREVYNKEYCIDLIEDLDGEQWKPIDDTGKYFISNLGRVKSYQGYYARILKPYPNQKGYLRVDIILSGQRKTYLVHQLVARAFIVNDNPILNDTVDHINLDHTDNRACNLRFLPRAINSAIYQQQKKLQEQRNAEHIT